MISSDDVRMTAANRPQEPMTAAEVLRSRFLDEVGKLDPNGWLVICQRFEAKQAELATVRQKFARLIHAGVMGLMSRKGFQEHRLAFNRWAHARLVAIIEGLPETLAVNGKPVPLRSLAGSAAQAAEQALGLFEEGITAKDAPRLATPALLPFEGYATLPSLPQGTAFPTKPQRQPRSTPGDTKIARPASMFHLRFPDDYFQYDEPPPAELKLVPHDWNRRRVFHETWRLPARPNTDCAFGGKQPGRCGVCGGPLHHLITLPLLNEPAFRKIGPLQLATCLSCLGWTEPVLWFRHDASGLPAPAGVSGLRRGAERMTQEIRATTVQLSETPARWRAQRWEEADDGNLSRLGGAPSWIQDPDVPHCYACRKKTTFLLQLDSGLPTVKGLRWLWGSGGLLYVFWCGRCRIDAQMWQCT